MFYFAFAPHWAWFILLPFHYLMGPIHGAIVNWCGHKYGYRNFNSDDASKNTLIFDFVTAGELFQNNHHKFGMSPNFAVRWFEVDPTWQVIKVLAFLKILKLPANMQKTRWTPADRHGDLVVTKTLVPIVAPVVEPVKQALAPLTAPAMAASPADAE